MAAPSDLRVVVDRLLQTEKTPVGEARWVDEHREGDSRLLYPLLVEGEVSDARLTIIAYPRAKDLQFRIVLSYGRAICRLDYNFHETHQNSFNRPTGLPLGPFTCPHYHSWEDNRRFATKNSLPEELNNARILDGNLSSFDNTFRWFCGINNVRIVDLGVPTLPKSDRFL